MDKVTRARHAKIEAHHIAAKAIREAIRAQGGVGRTDITVLVDGKRDEDMRFEIITQLEAIAGMQEAQASQFQSTFTRHQHDFKEVAKVEIR